MTTSLGAVVLLYDGMIKEVGKAKAAIQEGRIEDRFNATQKACKILLGLQSHLDFRSEEHTSELQSLMRISYAVFCLKKKNTKNNKKLTQHTDKQSSNIHKTD